MLPARERQAPREACPGALVVFGYSRFQTRIAASSTMAFDRTFIASATTWSKVAGLLIVGF
jgi:hypothetical protein